jgi:hypothetical protein
MWYKFRIGKTKITILSAFNHIALPLYFYHFYPDYKEIRFVFLGFQI